jgi:uncharacterized protein
MLRLVIELSAIPPEGISQHFSSTGPGLGIADTDLRVIQPVEIDCRFYKVDQDAFVQGSLWCAVRLTCSRCAEDFEQPLSVPLDAVYLPSQAMSSERARELDEGEADVYEHAEAQLDIAEMVRDRLLFAIPLQPLCRVGCKGLCPSCGVNRNTVSCQCAEEKLGSPFEPLKGLRFS